MSKKGKEQFEEEMRGDDMQVAGGAGSGRVGKVKRDYSVHDRVDGKDCHWFLKKGEEVSEEKMPKRYWELLRRENVI